VTLARSIHDFLRSRTLTVWLVGLFILYYLTTAVWLGEAFGRYVVHLSSSTLFRAFYLLFLANVVLRTVDALVAVRTARRTLLLRLPLSLGLVMFLCCFFLSLNFRQTLWLPPAGAGDTIAVPWETGTSQILSVEPALKKRALRTDDIAIFDFEPGITLKDADGRTHSIGAFPARKVGSTYYHVLQFGIGPGVELRRNREVLARRQVALRLTPFGVVDTFILPPYPYTFHLSIVPNRIIQKGKETARDYDLTRPRYQVEIVQGDRTIARGETETSLAFDGTMSLSFFPPDDWIIIEAVHDPYLLWLAIGAGLVVLGLILFPLSSSRAGGSGS